MTLAYWCILIGALMPILWTSLAKWGGSQKMPMAANDAPREFLTTLSNHQKRANWAQQNAFEAFPAFAAAVLVAHLAGAPQVTINYLAIAWVTMRLLHGVFYILNWSSLRSFAYFGGMGCVISLFIIAA